MRYSREIKSPLGQKLFLLLFFVIGAGLLIGAAYWTVGQVLFVAGAQRVEGELIGYEARQTSDGTSYRPQFRFTDSDGHTHEVTASSGSNRRPYALGAPVPVLYDRADPSRASIHDWGSLWIGPIILAVVGTGFLAITSIIFISLRPRWQKVAAEKRGDATSHTDAEAGEEMPPLAKKLMLVVFFVAGATAATAGAVWAKMQSQFLATAIETTGNIVRYESRRGDDGTTYHAVFTYTDAEGEVHEAISSGGSSRRPYTIGEEVEVLYDPQNPLNATINTWFSIWGGPVILGGLGGMFTLLSVIGFIAQWRGKLRTE